MINQSKKYIITEKSQCAYMHLLSSSFLKNTHLVLHHSYLQPFNVVFRFFFDELDPLKDIGDIIDPPLRGIELLGDYI